MRKKKETNFTRIVIVLGMIFAVWYLLEFTGQKDEPTIYKNECHIAPVSEEEAGIKVSYNNSQISGIALSKNVCYKVKVDKIKPCHNSSYPIFIQRYSCGELTKEWLDENCECIEKECRNGCTPYKHFDYDQIYSQGQRMDFVTGCEKKKLFSEWYKDCPVNCNEYKCFENYEVIVE